MKRSIANGKLVLVSGLVFLLAGCASYYKVTDPVSGREYYTDDIDTKIGGGSVKLKDARTKSVITLQNSEVKEISEEEYKAGLAVPVSKPEPAAAAPAPAAVPAPAETPAPSGETK